MINRLYVIYNLSHIPFVAVHCEWGEWAISACSVRCGSGTRTKTRTKVVEESNGGECSGNRTELIPCRENKCPGRHTCWPSHWWQIK